MWLWLGDIKVSKQIFGSSLTLQGMHDTQLDVFVFLYRGWHNSDGIKNTSGNKCVQDVHKNTKRPLCCAANSQAHKCAEEASSEDMSNYGQYVTFCTRTSTQNFQRDEESLTFHHYYYLLSICLFVLHGAFVCL